MCTIQYMYIQHVCVFCIPGVYSYTPVGHEYHRVSQSSIDTDPGQVKNESTFH